MAVSEISRGELETMVKARLEAAGKSLSLGIHVLNQPDENGCNWYLMAETADGWKLSDLLSDTSEAILKSIHAELSADYNLKLQSKNS